MTDKKILILDDEAEYLSVLKDFLREFNYTVEVTMFPGHALDIISKYKPELVLFDYKLPDMDGDNFLKKAKKLSGKTSYILITAYRDDVVINKFKKMGVDDVMLKPLDLQKLLEVVQNILKDSR